MEAERITVLLTNGKEKRRVMVRKAKICEDTRRKTVASVKFTVRDIGAAATVLAEREPEDHEMYVRCLASASSLGFVDQARSYLRRIEPEQLAEPDDREKFERIF